MTTPPKIVSELADMAGGTITECQRLPDGSGFATMSMPLPKDHWLTKEGFNVPPMPFRMGPKDGAFLTVSTVSGSLALQMTRDEFRSKIIEAARYAIRASTMNGKENDFDPDALAGNFAIGLLGYHTDDGLSSDAWANPPQP